MCHPIHCQSVCNAISVRVGIVSGSEMTNKEQTVHTRPNTSAGLHANVFFWIFVGPSWVEMQKHTFLHLKKYCILHFSIGPDTHWISITLSFPWEILKVLQKTDFPGNRELTPRAFSFSTSGKSRKSEMETREDWLFPSPWTHWFSPMAVFLRF